MKRTILEKLNSRKLWVALIGVVVGLAAAFGIEGGEYNEIAGIVTAMASVVSYIFAEGAVDAAGAKKPTEGADPVDNDPGVQ